MQNIIVVGSTGSVGTQTLDVAAAHPDLFNVVGLVAGANQDALDAQHGRFPNAQTGLGLATAERMIEDIEADVVVNAVAGSRGLVVSVAALEAGRRLALANKESLVAGGELIMRLAGSDQILPLDSEHAAVRQAMRAGLAAEIRRLVVTASGGPFRGKSRGDLGRVSPAEALAHPTWRMGGLVTTNSATLFNKGLEVIEAHYLFGIAMDDIEVVVHPESIVHSMVEFVDGSTIAQAAVADLRLAISNALSWPAHLPGAVAPLDWAKAHSWRFEPVDSVTFPAIDLARNAMRRGSTYPAAMNAANEVAVAAFHKGAIGFLDIVDIVDRVTDAHAADSDVTLESVLQAEETARTHASLLVGRRESL